ncbi:MAG: aminotransferase class I/II-fold pyridoxal phosphate-dependent enzyme [Verrucomicrobiales bacterium]|nr:aminotransferase class I/II-fold pyridoxal phosphate-dependent enzyme [Verrucomicrobiales bacterium]
MSEPDAIHPERTIDLRSDTLTQPTPEMRAAMAGAAVGDDVFGEDPTVQELQQRIAGLLGKEAALFMPSGTMSNQVAVRAHTEPGDEVLLESTAHIAYYESGAPAALSGVMCRYVTGERGIFTSADLRAEVRPANAHFPVTKLLCVENTHNRGGGSVWPLASVRDVTAVGREHGWRLHLDGARLWNASVATGVSERDYAAPFDSISVCFSKGLGAPVGSALAGSAEFIRRAHRFRKMFGGGLRQSGVLAAAALYALDHHRERLREDHANARRLAQGLNGLAGLQVEPAGVETNIVMIGTGEMPAETVARRLADACVRVLAVGPHRLRAVTHLHLQEAVIDEVIRRAGEALAN